MRFLNLTCKILEVQILHFHFTSSIRKPHRSKKPHPNGPKITGDTPPFQATNPSRHREPIHVRADRLQALPVDPLHHPDDVRAIGLPRSRRHGAANLVLVHLRLGACDVAVR